MRIKTVLLASTLAVSAVAGSAQAADRHGWYFGLEGGFVKVEDTDLAKTGRTTIEFSNRTGAVLGEVGYALNGHWRVEGELGYRRNKVNDIALFGGPEHSANGDLRNYTA